MVPPVAVQVTGGGPDDPSLHEPDTANCCVAPGASVIDGGVRTSAVRVGVTGGGGGSGALGPATSSAVLGEAHPPEMTASNVPRMAPAVYTLLIAIVFTPAHQVTGDRSGCRGGGPAPTKNAAAGHSKRGRQVR